MFLKRITSLQWLSAVICIGQSWCSKNLLNCADLVPIFNFQIIISDDSRYFLKKGTHSNVAPLFWRSFMSYAEGNTIWGKSAISWYEKNIILTALDQLISNSKFQVSKWTWSKVEMFFSINSKLGWVGRVPFSNDRFN